MATKVVIAQPKGKLGQRTTELVKHMEKEISNTSQVSQRALREAIQQEMKFHKFDPSTKSTETNLALPPNAIFHKSEKRHLAAETPLLRTEFRVARPTLPTAATICWTSLFLPPYLGGIPEPPQSQSSNTGGIVFYEDVEPEFGRLELLAVTYNDDPQGRSDGTMVSKVASDLLFIGDTGLGSIAGPATLTVTSPIHSAGSTLVLARGGANPTGVGLIRYTLRLSVMLLKADGNVDFRNTELTPVCRIAAGPPFGYNEGVQNFAIDNVLTASIPASTGDLALVGLQAELYVAVSEKSNLYVDGNLSHFGSLFQGPGFVSVPDVGISLC